MIPTVEHRVDSHRWNIARRESGGQWETIGTTSEDWQPASPAEVEAWTLLAPVPRTATRPRKLPALEPAPRRYSTESEAAYRTRVYRWRVWLDHDLHRAELGGADLAYASENEVQAYQQWRNQGVPA